jgi:outer membrane protein assembly factor BamA
MSPAAPLLALALLVSSQTPPREGEPESAAEPPARAAAMQAAQGTTERTSWFALPVVFWLPETQLGYGATGGLHFHVGDAERASSAFVAAVYTLERQGSLDLAGDLTLPNGAFLNGRVRAIHFPDRFYGIGPDSSEDDEERFTRQSVEGYLEADVPIAGSRFRLGPRLEAKAEEILDVEDGGQLASGGVEGSGGYSGLGVGVGFSRDTRDGSFWPSRGSLLMAWWVLYPPALSRNDGFGRGLAEARRFLPLGNGLTLGLAALTEWAHGHPPFTALPRLGSTRFLRGYREGRYRDRISWAGQAELRAPLWQRISGTVFAAIGDVAPKISSLADDAPKVAGGVGLRFRLTDQGANVRVDLAASEDGPAVYVLVLEAF